MTRFKFFTYKAIQKSGLTNMTDLETVSQLSGGVLTPEDVMDCITHYNDYKKGNFEEKVEEKVEKA